MKPKLIHLVILFLFAINVSCAQPAANEKTYAVSGIVMATHDYCGGAKPPDETLEKLKTPVPLSSKKLYLKKSRTNARSYKVAASFTSDSSGHFKVQLTPGVYCIVEEYKSKPFILPANDKFSTWDEDCLREEYAKCNFELTVRDHDVKDISLVFHIPCSWAKPCLQYRGPLPPAAPPEKKLE